MARTAKRASRNTAGQLEAALADQAAIESQIEPAIEDMSGYLARECFTIANHMTELSEELLNYHRDEDYKIVSIRDDLISAVRYAFMARRSGRLLSDCDAYGYAPGVGLFSVSNSRSSGPRIAKDVDFDLF